jgi:hypothetical protein
MTICRISRVIQRSPFVLALRSNAEMKDHHIFFDPLSTVLPPLQGEVHSDTGNSGRYGQQIDSGTFQRLFKPVRSAAGQFNSAMSIKPCNFKTAYGRDSDNVSALDQIVSDLSNEIDVLIDPP